MLQTFAGKNISLLKPLLHHSPQEVFGNREAGGVAYNVIDVAVGAFMVRCLTARYPTVLYRHFNTQIIVEVVANGCTYAVAEVADVVRRI